MRKSTGIILWVLIFSFGILWALADTRVFDSMRSGPRSLGEVNGDPISFEEYNSRVSYYLDQYSKQTGNSVTPEMRAYFEDQAWNELVTTKLIQQKMDELGISVTDQEVVDMITGKNPDPFIRQQFQKKDGTIDRVALQAAIDAPENSKVWIMIEQQLREKRRQQKMSNYVQSGMQVSKEDVEQSYIRNNTVASISYVRFPYADVAASDVSVTDADLQNYYDNHKQKYARKESYRFKYVSFDKSPTAQDTARTIKEMTDLRSDFASTDNDSLFFVRYQSATPYSIKDVKKSEVSDLYKPVLQLSKGGVSKVITNAGRVYTLKKLGEKNGKVKFIVFSFDIKADPIETVDKQAEKADDFSFFAEQDGFDKEAERRNLDEKEAFATKGNTFIAGLGQSRQVMDFLQRSDEGTISKPLELSSQFVVVKLTEKTPAGTRPFDEVKDQIKTTVTINKRKEATVKKVKDFLASNTTLDKLASASGKKVESAESLSMSASVIPGAGREPEVVGAIFGMKEGAISGAIEGANAVFVVKVDSRTDADLKNLTAQERQEIRQRLQQQKSAAYANIWLEQIKKEADIEDYRGEVLQSR